MTVTLPGAVLACALCVGVALAQAPVPTQAGPPRMTSESVEFCHRLGAELTEAQAAHPNAPARVRVLGDEGRVMCDKGQPHSGIQRLRHALMLLRRER